MDICTAAGNVGDGCPASWTDGLTYGGANWGSDCRDGCFADYRDTVLNAVSVEEADYLYLDANGFYNYIDKVNRTKFKRNIITSCLPSGDCYKDYIIKVKTQVSWNEKATILSSGASADHCCPNLSDPNCPLNVNNCITAEETFYNWYNYVWPTTN